MSGPTWLPPRTLDAAATEQTGPPMSHVTVGGDIYRLPNKKGPSSGHPARPKYSLYEQNGDGGGGGGSVHHSSSDHYYPPPPPHGPKEDRSWSPHMDGYVQRHRSHDNRSNIDADIDSLTSMLADLDSHQQDSGAQLYDNVPYSPHLQPERYSPAPQSVAPPPLPSRPSVGYPPHPPQSQYHHHQHPHHHQQQQQQQQQARAYPVEPQYHNPPNPHQHHHHHHPNPQQQHQQQYHHPNLQQQQQHHHPNPQQQHYQQQQDYSSSTTAPKPYPQPVPASYTTASTPTGPRFSVQVKTAQPVTYAQTGRQAEQAHTPPPPPRQQAAAAAAAAAPRGAAGLVPQRPPGPDAPAHRTPGAGTQGRREGPPERARGRPGPRLPDQQGEEGGEKGAATPRPEEELDRLTKKLVYDMNHPPVEEYFGRCARCGDNVLGDGSGCVAMEQVFHVECFTCITCHARLRGKPFYALDKKSYCESCYIAYHPRCFTCVVCSCCLDGVPFTVDATSQIHCIEDFHRKFAPRCSVCGQAIMPEPGQEETVRIVALDRSFHVNCYVCEEEGRGCYPLDGHILCKSCSARRIQDLSAKISTDC
ncbi:hypothetical protein CRUP_027178 [Coryphaenoides rupestris]|nr:hypothetical protein CRUP_027178 [Coryphaenoides rupestris]